MNKPLVSWLMTVYNSKEVERAIKSMLTQSYDNFEIIIVVEFGTDKETADICTSFEKKDSRIHLIWNKEKLGIAESLNIGLKHCKGKYIARMDADDYSYPSRLEIQVSYMENHPTVGILGGNTRIVQSEESGIESKTVLRYSDIPSKDRIKAELLFGTCFMHPSVMFRNNIEGLEYPNRMVEDYGLFAELSLDIEMAIIPEVILDYYDEKTNTCHSSFKRVRQDSAEISKEIIEKIFSIDVSKYHKSLFGWRNFDNMPANPKEYLLEALDLYKKILNKNYELCIYDRKALIDVLTVQWYTTMELVRPYVFPELYCSIEKINLEIIQRVFSDLDKDINLDRDKVGIYGIGYACDVWANTVGDEVYSKVFCYFDSNCCKWNTTYKNSKIASPDKINIEKCDYIAIASFDYYEEIKEKLIQQGFSCNRIISLPISNETKRFHKEYKRINHDLHKENVNVMFCGPDYGNIGDHAIAEAEHYFFKEVTGRDLVEIPCIGQRNYIELVKENVSRDELICITGGGFLGSLWIEGEKKAREVIEIFDDNPILIFPQTIYWESDKENERRLSETIYNAHKNKLIICARDEVSKGIMAKCYPNAKILLVPDMTLAIGWKNYFKIMKKQGALLCLKNDKESILSYKDKNELFLSLKEQFERVVINENNIDGMHSQDEWEVLIKNQLQLFADAELVVTDRLHGMIFSVITHTPCIVLDNCNHKLREAYKWFKENKNIKYLGTIENIDIKKGEYVGNSLDGFDCRFFSELKEVLLRLTIKDSDFILERSGAR